MKCTLFEGRCIGDWDMREEPGKGVLSKAGIGHYLPTIKVNGYIDG